MPEWTPKEIKDVLRTRERARLHELGSYLLRAAEAGHINFLYQRPWHRLSSRRTKEDDVGDTMLTLFNNEARLLQKYGNRPGFIYSTDALRRYVIGITWNVLQKRYQDRTPQWEQLVMDIESVEGGAASSRLQTRHHQELDLTRAVFSLTPRDQELFQMLYVSQFDPEEICARQGLKRNALEARKSRLLKHLIRFLGGNHDNGGSDD